MISFPKDFTATKYPGYFWNVKEKELYSMKVDGILKPLKRQSFYKLQSFSRYAWRIDCDKWLYQVSVKGCKKYLTDTYLLALELEDSQVPVKEVDFTAA